MLVHLSTLCIKGGT